MRIIIPVDDDSKTICEVFARCPYFMIVDTDTNEVECKENKATDAQQGAGIVAAQIVVDEKVDALITIRLGENSAKVLQAANIQIFKPEGKDALANVTLCKEGKLSVLDHFHGGYHGIM